jgi:hypothetical protein
MEECRSGLQQYEADYISRMPHTTAAALEKFDVSAEYQRLDANVANAIRSMAPHVRGDTITQQQQATTLRIAEMLIRMGDPGAHPSGPLQSTLQQTLYLNCKAGEKIFNLLARY